MIKQYLLLLFVACLSFGTSKAQTSDSLIVNRLRAEGVKFSHNNTVTLLMNGQEKSTTTPENQVLYLPI